MCSICVVKFWLWVIWWVMLLILIFLLVKEVSRLVMVVGNEGNSFRWVRI